VGLRLSRFTNKSDPEYKELSVSREKAFNETVKILNSKHWLLNIFRDSSQEIRSDSIKYGFAIPLLLCIFPKFEYL